MDILHGRQEQSIPKGVEVLLFVAGASIATGIAVGVGKHFLDGSSKTPPYDDEIELEKVRGQLNLLVSNLNCGDAPLPVSYSTPPGVHSA